VAKTSLLNAWSGRISLDSGVISVNGKPLTSSTMKRFQSKVAYVTQADVFFTHLTVRDQFAYTAFLRLPDALPKKQKLDEVERIIKLLRLTKVADSKIQMLSGGEKKRVNIGTELLTDPVCFWMNPRGTYGMAVAIVHVSFILAFLISFCFSLNKTIITSIHQPNSALFRSFDKLVVLAEGSVVYLGTPRESLSFLKDQDLDCPDGYNWADHWMDLLVRDGSGLDATSIDVGMRINESPS
jgi:ABC-type multidrug transport system ATPase subunit